MEGREQREQGIDRCEARTMTGDDLGMIDTGEGWILIDLKTIETIRARGKRIWDGTD